MGKMSLCFIPCMKRMRIGKILLKSLPKGSKQEEYIAIWRAELSNLSPNNALHLVCDQLKK